MGCIERRGIPKGVIFVRCCCGTGVGIHVLDDVAVGVVDRLVGLVCCVIFGGEQSSHAPGSLEGAAEVLTPEVGSEDVALPVCFCDQVPVVVDEASGFVLLPGVTAASGFQKGLADSPALRIVSKLQPLPVLRVSGFHRDQSIFAVLEF